MHAPSPAQRIMPLLFVVLWSTGFIGAKFGLPYAEPLTFLATRYVLVILLMAMLALAMRAPWPQSGREWLHIGVTGVLVQALYLGGVFVAIHRGLPAGVTALVVGMQPLLTAVGAGLLLGERVSIKQWGGLALGFFGVTLVVSNKVAIDGVAPDALGYMLAPALAALIGITAGTLYQKRFCPRFDLRTGSVVQFVPTLILTALIASQTETMAIEWSGDFIFALLWLVVVLSLGAISLLNLLIRSGSAVNVASLFYLTPPTTALIAWAMFGETLTGMALAGMAVAVAGVWLARKA
ncbi:DMT family transporter [Parazoarcus communis]|uniref:EamA/RhaT family transporter n=1 Tax=Parazoarcus communis SWub3 = DSM 12120 TaxID=1121029 RepID=A0A323V0I7_9RHOO|nr:DMT family transporter [Parazoarcus communis]NMG70054.1 EamA family transporter [Parazoarcus communis SWub3 = DSM 12120]PZA18237.1 EamA/RhaT family transporter [Azoarcus communis] [Parazoarcus communis SWub3 = DSM 12120]